MKKTIFTYAVAMYLALLAIQSTCRAAPPVANSNFGREYLVGSSALEQWSTGLFGGIGERNLTRGGSDFDMDFSRGMAYLGYDVLSWVTLYAAVGVSDVEFRGVDAGDSDTELGAGLQLNLLDHEIMDPTLSEDRLRINAQLYVGRSAADWQGNALEWTEFSGHLTASLVNDLDGSAYYVPVSIALYGGPAYSNLESDDFDTQEKWGFVGGLEIFLTKRVTLDLSITKYDKQTLMASTNIRF